MENDKIPEKTTDATTGLDKIAQVMEAQVELMKSISPLLSTLVKLTDDLNTKEAGSSITTDDNGDIIINSYDVPSNHFDNSNSFKGKDTDVERFLSMCEKQFNYYAKFYSSEKEG